MDTITHALMGLFVGIALAGVLKFKDIKMPTVAGIIAGLLPDIDIVATLFGSASYFRYHRVMTHSLVAAFAFALVIALAFSRFRLSRKNFFQSDFSKYYALGFAAVMSHLFLDFVTAQGIMFLYPFSMQMFSWAVMPLVDVFLLVLFASGIMVMKILPKRKVKVSGLVLLLIAGIFAFKCTLYEFAENRVYGLDGFGHAALFPHSFDPFEWRVVADDGDAFLVADYSLINGMTGRHVFEKEFSGLVEASRDSELVQVFTDISVFPFAKVEGGSVKWFDLRISDDGHLGYTAMVNFDDERNILEEKVGL